MELNSVYITSKNAARHIKKSLSKKIIFPETEGGGGEKSLRDEEETSVISLTTMSSEAALAITNEKTIKDEDKDKLKWLVFHGNNDEDGVGVWSSASLSSAFWWQLRSLACVRASA